MSKASDLKALCEKKIKSKTPERDHPDADRQGKWIKSQTKRVKSWTKEYADGSFGYIVQLGKEFNWDFTPNSKVSGSKSGGVILRKGNTDSKSSLVTRVNVSASGSKDNNSGVAATIQGAQTACDEAYRKWRK